jgi:acid phosphatase (class B)
MPVGLRDAGTTATRTSGGIAIQRYIFCVLLVLATALGCSTSEQLVVGFDLDDTLAFSTPAFTVGFESDTKPFSDDFWEVVNASDAGRSVPKASVKALLDWHLASGHRVVVVTARKGIGTAPVVQWVASTFGLEADAIHFAKPKTEVLRRLRVRYFYGDSDSDITDAIEAGAVPIRIQRSAKSSYRRKYHPGAFGELVLNGTSE